MTINYIDLFAGCGGLSLGLKEAGFKGIFAVEKHPDAFHTLKHNLIDSNNHFNWPEWLEQKNWEISNLLQEHKIEIKKLSGNIDLLVGGPPCQGFSTAGKRNESDNRNKLINSYLEFIALIKPRILIIENVYGFTYKFSNNKLKKNIPYSEIVIKKLQELGYADAVGKKIDMSDYGVPQRRKRFILIATLAGNAGEIFNNLENGRNKFLKTKNLNLKTSSQDAISDLEFNNGFTDSPDTINFNAGILSKPKSKFQYHIRKPRSKGQVPDSHRYVNHRTATVDLFETLISSATKNQSIPLEEREKFGVKKRNVTILDPNHTSPTLTTIPDDIIHYSEPRVMTVRECARLQTFPDWYEIKGPYTTGGKQRKLSTPRYTQIGNAVPPLFAEQIGNAIKQLIISSVNK